MKYFNEQLQALQEQVAKKEHLKATLDDLYEQRRDLKDKIRELNRIRMSENADVEKLEGISLQNLYYLVIGKKEEMLDKERQEAYAAQIKYESAQQELDAVDEEIQKKLEQMKEFSGCEQQYAKLKEEKKAQIKESMSPTAARILELEEAISVQESQLAEIREASSVGGDALRIAESIVNSLDKAKNWSMWDTFGGGGIITEVAKRSNLNDAQNMVGELQMKLRKYKTELADVTVKADIEVGIDGFLNFADYFFDSMLVDWTVLNKIKNSKSQAEMTKSKISMMQFRLNDVRISVERERDRLKEELDALVVEAEE